MKQKRLIVIAIVCVIWLFILHAFIVHPSPPDSPDGPSPLWRFISPHATVNSVTALYAIRARKSKEAPGSCVGQPEKDHWMYFDPATGASDASPPITVAFLNASIPDELRYLKLDMLSTAREKSPLVKPFQRRSVGAICREINAVLCYAVIYRTFLLRELIISFQQHASVCDRLYLIVDTNHSSLLQSRHRNVRLVNRHEFIHNDKYTRQPSTERIVFFSAWLKVHSHRFRFVLIVDARDTIFYGDPFAPFYKWNAKGIVATGELFEYYGEPLNQISMKELFPADPVSPFLSNIRFGRRRLPVLNSGLFGGTSAAILDYMHCANHSLQSIGDPGTIIDQVIFMVLLTLMLPHHRFPHPIIFSSSWDGPYRHMLPQKGAIAVTSQLTPINCNGLPYLIQHQTDRCSLFDESRGKMSRADAFLMKMHNEMRGLVKQFVIVENPVPEVEEEAPISSSDEGSSRAGSSLHSCLWRNLFVVFVTHRAGVATLTAADVMFVEMWVSMFQRTFTICDELVIVFHHSSTILTPQDTSIDVDHLAHGPTFRVHWAFTTSPLSTRSEQQFAAREIIEKLMQARAYKHVALVLKLNLTAPLMNCIHRALILRNPFTAFVEDHGDMQRIVKLDGGSGGADAPPLVWLGTTSNILRSLIDEFDEEDDSKVVATLCPLGKVCCDMITAPSDNACAEFWSPYLPDARAEGTSETFIVRCLVCETTQTDANFTSDGDHKKCDARFRVIMVNASIPMPENN